MKKENLFCKTFGHKYVKVVDNRLYYTKTCTRCGDTIKVYYDNSKQVMRKIKVYS